jgi:hypothetical protein
MVVEMKIVGCQMKIATSGRCIGRFESRRLFQAGGQDTGIASLTLSRVVNAQHVKP